MAEFNYTSKSGELYLDIAANGNGDEKAALSIAAINRLSENGISKIQMLEVGPGGGSSINALADAYEEGKLPVLDMTVSFLELDGVESTSLTAARQRLDVFAESRFIKGDLKNLSKDHQQKSNIISASAVLHEVYSYGGGYDAIDASIAEIANNLDAGGYFAYRDVLTLENRSLHERTRHIYDRESWVRFIGLFLPHYLNQATHPYHRHEDRVIIEQESNRIDLDAINMDEDLSISSPIGLLREIQRHYITLRDYVWRTGAIGVTPVLEGPESSDWIDLRRGHKRVHFNLDNDDNLLESMSEMSDNQVTRVVDGDIFDATTEVLLGRFLREVCEGTSQQSINIWQQWLEREGSETYAYLSLSSLLGSVAIESLAATDGKKILMPVHQGDVQVAPRAYYNRFLQSRLSNPIKDGKQLVLFEAIDLEEKTNSGEGKLQQALSTMSEFCTKKTLSDIYTVIRKRY